MKWPNAKLAWHAAVACLVAGVFSAPFAGGLNYAMNHDWIKALSAAVVDVLLLYATGSALSIYGLMRLMCADDASLDE